VTVSSSLADELIAELQNGYGTRLERLESEIDPLDVERPTREVLHLARAIDAVGDGNLQGAGRSLLRLPPGPESTDR